jgi:hypothetical protein
MAAEETVTQGTALAGAGASAAGSAWSIANDAAQAVFGIPIGVVLAAAAGAFFARTFTPASSLGATLRGWAAWTLAGAYTLPLAMHLMGWPQPIAASVAFILSCALQLIAPAVVPMIVRNSPEWVRAIVDRWTGRSKPGGQ